MRSWILRLLVLIMACSPTRSPPPLDGGQSGPIMLAAPLAVVVYGEVTNLAGQPIAGVAVTSGTQAYVATGADGTFSLQLGAGEQLLALAHPGHVSRSVRVAAVGGTASLGAIPMAAVGATLTVPDGGSSLQHGAAQLELPPGAFAVSTVVTLTHLSKARLSAMGAPQRFRYADRTYALVDVANVDVTAQPSVPVRLTLPLAAGAKLFTLTDAGWSEPLDPVAQTSTTMSFAVPHFTLTATATADGTQGVIVKRVSGTVTAIGADGRSRPLSANDGLLPGETVETGANGFVELEDETQAQQQLSADTKLRVDQHVVDKDQASSVLSLLYGRLRAVVTKYAGARSVQVRTPDTLMGVRGTVFSIGSRTCPSAADRTLYTAEVATGEVEFTTPSGTMPITAGNQVLGCVGCPAEPSCGVGCRSRGNVADCGVTAGDCTDGHRYQVHCRTRDKGCFCTRDGVSSPAPRDACRSHETLRLVWVEVCGFPENVFPPPPDPRNCGRGDGEPCCAVVPCEGNLVCDDQEGICKTCGGTNQPCCAFESCSSSQSNQLFCFPFEQPQTCARWGDAGGRCCFDGELARCHGNAACNMQYRCEACGEVGQPCCTEGRFKPLQPPGTTQPGAPDCVRSGSSRLGCATGATCDSNTNSCVACGTNGEACCAASPTCENGLSCQGTGPGPGSPPFTCKPCAGVGVTCPGAMPCCGTCISGTCG